MIKFILFLIISISSLSAYLVPPSDFKLRNAISTTDFNAVYDYNVCKGSSDPTDIIFTNDSSITINGYFWKYVYSGYSNSCSGNAKYTRYHWRGDSTACPSGQTVINNQCSNPPLSCPKFMYNIGGSCVENPCYATSLLPRRPQSDGSCSPATAEQLSADNPQTEEQCYRAGGYSDYTLKSNGSIFSAGGVQFTRPFSCKTNWDVMNDTMALALGFNNPLHLSNSPDLLGKYLLKGYDKVKGFLTGLGDKIRTGTTSALDAFKDLRIGMPRIQSNGLVEPDIVMGTVPTNSSGVPIRSPYIDIDPNTSFLNNTFFPTSGTSNSLMSHAELDRFNRSNNTFQLNNTNPQNYNYVPNANINGNLALSPTSTAPMYDSLRLNSAVSPIPNVQISDDLYLYSRASNNPDYVPVASTRISDVPIATTTTTSNVAGRSVSTTVNTLSYSDGSSLQETIQIDDSLRRGTISSTTIDPDGSTSTASTNFNAPYWTNYYVRPAGGTVVLPRETEVVQTSPWSDTVLPINYDSDGLSPIAPNNPTTGYPASTPNVPVDSPSLTATGQDLINAAMPSFFFNEDSNFTLFDLTSLTTMRDDFTSFMNSIVEHINTAKTVFESTQTILSGSFTSPVIATGSCGNFMSFDFHGHNVNLCDSMSDYTSQYSAIFSYFVTITGMIIAVRVYLGGMNA